MMNYDKAREMEDHTWNYSRQNDDRIHPIGYCRGTKDTCHKHTTKEEAEECYKKYMLDNHLRLDGGFMKNQKLRCQIKDCDEWTQNTSYIQYQQFILCDEHRNRKTIESIYNCSGESIHS